MTTDYASTTARTPSGYDTIWALFTDWCAVTGHRALPAEPTAVAAFLVECRCAPATQRRRVAAIDHRHAAAGLIRPGQSPAVVAALGRSPEPGRMTSSAAAVDAALRALPSHGWTQGMFGRRDRCLLVRSQLAGVPYQHLAHLTAGRVTVAGGVATTAGATGATTVNATPNPCPVRTLRDHRWLRVLDVVMTKPSHRVLARQIDKAEPITDQSPHLCGSTREISSVVVDVPLLPSIDQWGYAPFPLQRLTPHSLSRLVHQMMAGDFVTHRRIPIDDEELEPEQPVPAPVEARRVYSHQDAAEAWARRRADLRSLDDVARKLTVVDRRLNELNHRADALFFDDFGGEPIDVA